MTTSDLASPITATVDFAADGVHHGHLKLPHSDDQSAWGAIMTPVTVINNARTNGQQPTALLTGGNHGDEYEGPTALMELANNLDPSTVSGRVIIVPMMNYPAFRAGTRTSPLDRGNMNRAFPGKADGSATEKIADYFQRTLLPMADYVLDIHSGGKTLQFIPYAGVHHLPDAAQQARCEAAMHAFAAPYCVRCVELDAVGMYDTAAEDQGKVFVSTELGGGGTTTPYTTEIARTGIHNFLVHAGILQRAPIPRASVLLDMPGDECFVTAEHAGLLELLVELGAAVAAGQEIARIYDVERMGEQPRAYVATLDGILFGRHHPGLVRPGDMIAAIAVAE